MLSLTREGCQNIIIETSNPDAFEKNILKSFEYFKSDYTTSFNNSSEGFIILLLTDHLKAVNNRDEFTATYSIKSTSSEFLSFLLNCQNKNLFSGARICPKSIIVRLMGNMEKAIKRISSDLDACQGNFSNLFDQHGSGTIISFTDKNLNHTLTLDDIYPISLFVERDSPSIKRHFRIHALEYLNISLENRDWYELTIKIYDSYQNFDLHYKRLLYTVEQLGLGLILGESWGKDTASVFQSVGIYKVRLFTFLNPIEFKKILTGLEYTKNGKRIVDMDLYTQKKKIRWHDLRTPEIKDKKALGQKYYDELFKKLSEEQSLHLDSLNKQVHQAP